MTTDTLKGFYKVTNQWLPPLYNAFSVTSARALPTQGAPLRVGPWAKVSNAFGVAKSLRDQLLRAAVRVVKNCDSYFQTNAYFFFGRGTFAPPRRRRPGARDLSYDATFTSLSFLPIDSCIWVMRSRRAAARSNSN